MPLVRSISKFFELELENVILLAECAVVTYKVLEVGAAPSLECSLRMSAEGGEKSLAFC
jgi:hypothetical protein